MVRIQILKDEEANIPDRYLGIVRDELLRVLSMSNHNRGMDIRVVGISVKYTNTPNGIHMSCSMDRAEYLNIKVRFDRLDRSKESYTLRSSGHLGLQIFIPKKIKKRRDNLISDILDNLES